MLPQSWTQRRDYERQAAPVTPEQPTPFFTAVRNAARDQVYTRNEGGRETYLQQYLLERHRQIEAITGERLDYAEDMGRTSLGSDGLYTPIQDPYAPDAAFQAAQRTRLSVADYEARIDALRRRFPEMSGIDTRDQVMQRSAQGLDRIRATTNRDADSGLAGAVGGFVGGTGAAMVDLPNLVTGVATGGLGVGRPILMRLGAQALANAGAEAAQTPRRAQEAAEFGGPQYTGGEILADVVGAGVGAAGMELAMDGGRWIWRRAAQQLGRSDTPIERAIADRAEQLMEDEDLLEGVADFDAARAALDRGDLPPEPQLDQELDDLFGGEVLQGVAVSQGETVGAMQSVEYMGRRIWSGRFDPLQVEADAARFQYKADGDADGVTPRLRGIERWDTTASGKALLFEDNDGRIFVADGHQRRGLARRLAEQGWEDAQLDGYLFKASDGWTDRQVRVVAALKNIREGSGSIMDAAKLFREAPGAVKDRSLPITGDFIHQARQLASLSDGAFRAVANGVIPERYGAAIGEVATQRPDLHGDLVDLIRRADPKTGDGARALIHEAMLDDFIASEGVQADLFGGLPRESTVIARGKIREAVMRGLRKDERTFGALVKNADAVEAGGNVLARNENEARLSLDRAAQSLVSRLSLRSGDIGDAFADAAAAVTKGELTPAAAAKGLTQRIRNAIKAGELLEAERKSLLDPAPPSEAAIKHVQSFDEPAGAGQKAQLEPKPEDAKLEGHEGIDPDQRLAAIAAAEAETRTVLERERSAFEKSREIAEELRRDTEHSRPLIDTRGKAVQYHGARAPIGNLSEGYYNPSNIYGGFDTFYTTDATDIATGYGRNQSSAVVYEVREIQPVKYFDMEEARSADEWSELFGIDRNSHAFDQDILDVAAEEYTKPNLRQIMDTARDLSSGHGFSKDDVQEIFSSYIYILQENGFGGMRHVGGLKTDKSPHEVKIYFRPHEQVEVREIVPERGPIPSEMMAKLAEVEQAMVDSEKAMTAAQETLEILKAEKIEIENETRPAGLFDDLINDNLPEERALDVLAQCAPGGR